MGFLLPRMNSEFLFNLPSDFIPREVLADYDGLIDQMQMPYTNILDFLNHTIKSISFPGFSAEPNKQTTLRGKYIGYKPAKPFQDLITTREINVIFNTTSGSLNYFILLDIFQKHYLDTDHLYVQPIMVSSLDPFKNAIYTIKYYEVILVAISETTFDYSVQKVNPSEFTLTFVFNYMNIDFNLTKAKILDVNNKSVLGNNLPISFGK